MAPSKLDLMMLNTTIDPILQSGIDILGCQGVGGIAAIGLSLLQSGKISLGSFGNLTSSFSSLTNQTYTIKEGGNTYTANLANKDITQGITLNGQPVVRAVTLIVLHGKSPVFEGFWLRTGLMNVKLFWPSTLTSSPSPPSFY
jgi:hypothetical protein